TAPDGGLRGGRSARDQFHRAARPCAGHRECGVERRRPRATRSRCCSSRAIARVSGGELMAVTSNEERLPRLLALVPYLQARPGIAVAQAAADFGVSEAQLRRDLTLL